MIVSIRDFIYLTLLSFSCSSILFQVKFFVINIVLN